MSEHLVIKPAPTSYQPGGLVTGTLEVLEPVEANELTVALEYRESTADYHALARTVTARAPLHRGPLAAGQSFSFSFELPGDALPNQSGQFGTISWGLHAR